MTGPHRVKRRNTVKLLGPQYPYNSTFAEKDPPSQNTLLPAHKLSLTASQKQSATARRLVSQEFAKLSAHDQAVLNDYAGSHQTEGLSSVDNLDLQNNDLDSNDDEYEDVEVDSIATSFTPTSRYRSWIERNHNASAAWSDQYEELADAYLHYNGLLSGNDPVIPNNMSDEAASGETQSFVVETVDLFARESNHCFNRQCDEHPNVALVKAGYISPSPTHPTTAISIRTLNLFKLLRRRMPQFSIQAFTKVLCDLHLLSTTLDVYFTILRIIDSRLLSELKRDGPDWRLKNACPACTYKLDNEPELKYSMMICGDGNMSLKRYVRSGEDDPRQYTSAYMLEPEEVNQYQLGRPSRRQAAPTEKQPELDTTNDEPGEDDLAPPSACAPRWKNARNENTKHSFDVLDETGIFVVLCRHGRVLIAADMVQSGEGAKYPLATFSKVIRTHGKNVLAAYDIGCQHSTTAHNHPLTKSLVLEMNTEYIVDGFHGWAHNRLCQLDWHPTWRPGTGMEDFAGCERFFSHSNGVARCTQHGTKYNRRQQVDQHFEVSDDDALANMGKFLSNNFAGAIRQLEESLQLRDQCMDAFNIQEKDFLSFVDAERKYLDSLSSESLDKSDAIELVEALENMTDLQNQIDKLLSAPTSVISQDKPIDLDKAIATRRRNLTSRLLLVYQTIQDLELRLDVNARWTSDCPEWKQAVADRHALELKAVVDQMEQLCIQRIFELEKLLNGSTGYQLRELISKGLAARSKALKSAVSKYNKLALQFNPPRKQISTQKVLDMANLSDFQLLRKDRHDILSQKWARPEVREATMHSLRVDRAREELVRVQVEARRLQTWMRDDIHHMTETLKRLEVQRPLLAIVLRSRLAYQTRINESIYAHIQHVESSHYFNGVRGPGSRKTSANDTGFTAPPLANNISNETSDHHNPLHDESDDDFELEMTNLTEGFDRIAHAVHT
ncbi:hypothetical protein FRC09_004173 [Ceratobasidium sp. 395]|nr:hypothetical protein FRC09_004173 [Ceratobasidium sp. 395]